MNCCALTCRLSTISARNLSTDQIGTMRMRCFRTASARPTKVTTGPTRYAPATPSGPAPAATMAVESAVRATPPANCATAIGANAERAWSTVTEHRPQQREHEAERGDHRACENRGVVAKQPRCRWRAHTAGEADQPAQRQLFAHQRVRFVGAFGQLSHEERPQAKVRQQHRCRGEGRRHGPLTVMFGSQPPDDECRGEHTDAIQHQRQHGEIPCSDDVAAKPLHDAWLMAPSVRSNALPSETAGVHWSWRRAFAFE